VPGFFPDNPAGMKFRYSRTIHFSDTDAAGVVYFARYFSICHEAYEEALLEAGIVLNRFFGDEGIIIPISHANSNFLRPLRCGDQIEVELVAERLKESEFALNYTIWTPAPARKAAATARTHHVCIDSATRRRRPLPPPLAAWIES
jgi:1,4-dihydroxy-2-naphthoyl-CoA hydrolase